MQSAHALNIYDSFYTLPDMESLTRFGTTTPTASPRSSSARRNTRQQRCQQQSQQQSSPQLFQIESFGAMRRVAVALS